jgi:hypothetical protein
MKKRVAKNFIVEIMKRRRPESKGCHGELDNACVREIAIAAIADCQNMIQSGERFQRSPLHPTNDREVGKEQPMNPDMFEKPVTMLLGLGIPTEVKSVMHAYQILMDWRNAAEPSRELALKACKAAINGEIEAETARAVFVAFAERNDLLAPEIGLVAQSNKRNRDSHVR